MTQRQKIGLSMIIGNGIGAVVGVVVYLTTSTPLIVPLAAQFIAAAASTYLGIVITTPNIPE